MKTYVLPIFFAFLFGACADPESEPGEVQTEAPAADAGCIAPADELTGSGIGDLRIGMSADELAQQCDVAADTTVTGIEGHPQRIALVVAGADTIRTEIVDGAVWRINVEAPTWKTSDSLGVGSPISALLELPEAQGLTGEGNLVITSPRHCGLSFQVDAGDTQPPPGDAWDDAALSRIPDTATVELVRITGCPEPTP